VQAEVAILMDWENWWALELSDKPSNDLRLVEQLMTYYAPLFKRNITVDFAHPASDLARYKLVIAPNLYLVNARAVENINHYVEQGGNLVMSFFSGIVDENEHIRLGGYPAPFREMLGLAIEEYVPYSETQSNTLCTEDGRQFGCSFWSDVIHLNGAQALATYEQEYYAGGPAITRNQFGQGNTFYVGTVPDANGMDWLVEQVCRTADVKPVVSNVPAGVEVLRRVNGTSSWLFLLNHSAAQVSVTLEGKGQDLLTGRQVNGSIEIEPAGAAIVQVDRDAEP
jgi:beta-galactosidase